MVRSILIPQDAAHGPFLVELDEVGSFQEMVDGWLDLLEIPSLGATLYYSASGRRERRPLNTRATAFWWLYSAQPTESPLILGDVVLTGAGDYPDGSDIPDPVIEQIFVRDEFVVQVHPRDRAPGSTRSPASTTSSTRRPAACCSRRRCVAGPTSASTGIRRLISAPSST